MAWANDDIHAETLAALRQCQRVLETLIEPKAHASVGVITVWANCVAAELAARNAIAKAMPLDRSAPRANTSDEHLTAVMQEG